MQGKAFEVFSFRMMQAYGMIDGLAQPFDQRHSPSGIDGGAKDDFLK